MDLLNHHRDVVDTMDVATSSSYRLTSYSGSLAYSISFGRVRLIQLNNEPTYRVDFDSGWAWPFEPRDKFRINDALGWLEGQLKEAYENGQIVLLNLHQPDDWDGTEEDLMHFRDMINHFVSTRCSVATITPKPEAGIAPTGNMARSRSS